MASENDKAAPDLRRGLTPLVAIALLMLAAAPATLGRASAAAPQPRLAVYFVRGEQLARVSRPGTTPAVAMRQLVAGPTRAEITLGFRTYVPAGTRVRSVTVAHGLATVDLKCALQLRARRRQPAGRALAGRPHAHRASRCRQGPIPDGRQGPRRPVPARLHGPSCHDAPAPDP